MATKDEVVAAVQAALDAANALETTVVPTVTEVDVKESDGTTETFTAKP